MQVKAIYSGINHSIIRTSLKLGHPANQDATYGPRYA